jgi:hypothetical protein
MSTDDNIPSSNSSSSSSEHHQHHHQCVAAEEVASCFFKEASFIVLNAVSATCPIVYASPGFIDLTGTVT